MTLRFYVWKFQNLKYRFEAWVLDQVRRRVGYYEDIKRHYADGMAFGIETSAASPIVRDWLDMGLVPVTADQVNPYRVYDGVKRPDDFRTAAAKKAYWAADGRPEPTIQPFTDRVWFVDKAGVAHPELPSMEDVIRKQFSKLTGFGPAMRGFDGLDGQQVTATDGGFYKGKVPRKKTKRARRKK